ncbi:hypothetical protein DEU36_0119 [Microbacterium sp. AG238]|nr:hypothetical protein DEU36_0119 [Microbacterium sp. AG238]
MMLAQRSPMGCFDAAAAAALDVLADRSTRGSRGARRNVCLLSDSGPFPGVPHRWHRLSLGSCRPGASPSRAHLRDQGTGHLRRRTTHRAGPCKSRPPRCDVRPRRRSRCLIARWWGAAGHAAAHSPFFQCECSMTLTARAWQISGLPSAGREASQTRSCASRIAVKFGRPPWECQNTTSPTSAVTSCPCSEGASDDVHDHAGLRPRRSTISPPAAVTSRSVRRAPRDDAAMRRLALIGSARGR